MKLIQIATKILILTSLIVSSEASILQINGITGNNNNDIPANFGSNITSNDPGVTISNGATPNIALTWAGGAGGWDLHGKGVAFWTALDATGPFSSTPTIAQMESPSSASPNTITFTVEAGWKLQLDSVDIGMATDKTSTYHWNVTISEVGGAIVFNTLTAAMDGDGSSGVKVLSIPLNFTGNPGVDYIIAFNDVDGSGNDTISTNGGAIDNLNFRQVAAGPDLTDPELAPINPFHPANGDNNVSTPSNLVVTFNEFITLDSGNITLWESPGDTIVETFVVANSPQLEVNGSSITIDPSNNLNSSTDYYITIDASAVNDLADNSFAGINNSNTWSFSTDSTNPGISNFNNPANGSISTPVDSSLDLTFNEDVKIGTGDIIIRKASDNSIVKTISVSSGDVTVNGATVSINIGDDLPTGTELYIEINDGAFLDLSDNSFPGISGAGVWSFTTETAPIPIVLNISPNDSGLDFSWPSKPRHVYDLLSSPDLSTPVNTWMAYDPDGLGGIAPYARIPSGGSITTLTMVPTSGPRHFYVIREKKQILVEAHRGYSQNAPENTVASIVAAAPSADLTEFDVRISSDGKLVLMHDRSVSRTTNGSGNLSSLTLAQIQTLDAGSWFSAAFAGEPVPTMTEAINSCLANNIEPLIEQKAGPASAYHAEFVAQGFTPEQFRVISFDVDFLDALDALNPEYRLGILKGGTINQSVIDGLKSKGVDFLDWNHGSVNQAVVDLVHANGMELHVYTVNDSARMQQLIDFGVDGITTDNPVLLRSLLP